MKGYKMITKLNRHNNCDVQIVIGHSFYHYAHLECINSKCKHKTRWIQWLSVEDTESLQKIGIPVGESPVVKIGGKLFDRKSIGL